VELPSGGKGGWRRMVKDASELEQYWRGKNGCSNVYMTAYGYNETAPPRHHRVNYNSPRIHHFVMDFDCKDFKNRGADVAFNIPHEEVRALHRMLMEDNTLHYVWFTGGGFHVWVRLDNTLEPSTGNELSRIKYSGRLLIEEWERRVGDLRCNDPTVAFDTSGMIRIPNSYNSRRECWSIPLTSQEILDFSFDDLMDKAMEPHHGYVQLGSEPLRFRIAPRPFANMANLEPVNIPEVSFKDIHILPCLSQAAMGGGNPTHRARLHFASYLADRLRMFFRAERVPQEDKDRHKVIIADICAKQEWVDYNPDITGNQVASIVDGGYPHPTCSTLYTEGFCVGKCKYYDGTGDF